MDGKSSHMKKTLFIDDELLARARQVSGASTDTETVRFGLEALLRRAAYQRLQQLRGAEPTAPAVPRRRGRTPRKRRAA
jgi:Arc/MetJ family transcription regulator